MSTILKIALLFSALGLSTITTAVASDLVNHDPYASDMMDLDMPSCTQLNSQDLSMQNNMVELKAEELDHIKDIGRIRSNKIRQILAQYRVKLKTLINEKSSI